MNIANIGSVNNDVMRDVDAIVLLDFSSSMTKPSARLPGRNRSQELSEDTAAICREFDKFDSDGLTVIRFASQATMIDGVTASKVEQIFSEVPPRGSTNMTEALELAVQKARASTKKHSIVLIFTDGEPDNQQTVIDLLNKIGSEIGRPKIGFCFIQVGDDPSAAAFLAKLDGGLPVDVCATVSAKDAESLTAQNLVWAALNA